MHKGQDQVNILKVESTTVLPAKSDNDVMFCLQLIRKTTLIHTT